MCFRHDENCMMYCPFHGYDLIHFSGFGWACPAEKCAIKIKDEQDVCKFMGKASQNTSSEIIVGVAGEMSLWEGIKTCQEKREKNISWKEN